MAFSGRRRQGTAPELGVGRFPIPEGCRRCEGGMRRNRPTENRTVVEAHSSTMTAVISYQPG